MVIAGFASCNDDDEEENVIDTEKPAIDITIEGASPANGATFYFGESIPVKLLLTDNAELGAYNINIHNNFDHHSHSTEEEGEEHEHEGEEEEGEEHHHHEGEDGDAFFYSKDYTITAGSKEFSVDDKIDLPTTCEDGDAYAGGDYHFMITVTDKAGFSTFKALEIKILQKETAEQTEPEQTETK
ncbi:MAG: DUF4625 domain-containing protein [Bacteroidales bacterium]|nr:DUF4625 domain-containing protein [Bacteroidales bacterium]